MFMKEVEKSKKVPDEGPLKCEIFPLFTKPCQTHPKVHTHETMRCCCDVPQGLSKTSDDYVNSPKETRG